MSSGGCTSAVFSHLREPPVCQTLLLAAECLVLAFEPREGVLKMLRIEVWPIFVSDIKIRINRLHRKKTTQPASSSPTHNQIQS